MTDLAWIDAALAAARPQAVATAKELAAATGSAGAFELRPLMLFRPGAL